MQFWPSRLADQRPRQPSLLAPAPPPPAPSPESTAASLTGVCTPGYAANQNGDAFYLTSAAATRDNFGLTPDPAYQLTLTNDGTASADGDWLRGRLLRRPARRERAGRTDEADYVSGGYITPSRSLTWTMTSSDRAARTEGAQRGEAASLPSGTETGTRHERAAQGTRGYAAITLLVGIASATASFCESYRGLFLWLTPRAARYLGRQVFPCRLMCSSGVGELALFVALADSWPLRSRVGAWGVTLLGLAGHASRGM